MYLNEQKSQSIASNAGPFVRGFFYFLEEKKIHAASLHGGAEGFEGELSDVDLVVEKSDYTQLSDTIHEYCEKSGWQLCQILRHETTAAFFVCSQIDDPTQVVALDVCSDYQRNSILYLTADELLLKRETLPWGGHGLEAATELKYRFAKAAAKSKDSDASAREFAGYPEEARKSCSDWLMMKWGIDPGKWDNSDVSAALAELRKKSNSRPSLFQKGSITRILERMIKPTGLVVILGKKDFESKATSLKDVFGHLYFRKVHKAPQWQSTLLKDLVSSTLILIPHLPRHFQILLPSSCVIVLDPSADTISQSKSIAQHLHQRIRRRR